MVGDERGLAASPRGGYSLVVAGAAASSAGCRDRFARERATDTTASPTAASTSSPGTTPRAARSEVASASVPTVTGASSTANELTITARPLASAVRSGASPTVTDSPIGNRLPRPSPTTNNPATACAGDVDGQSTANPTAVVASATASSRAGSYRRASPLPIVRPA